MGALKKLLDPFLEKYLKEIRVRLLGPNNERLDFVMDSFYKLSPTQRNGVVAVGVGAIVFVIGIALVLYFGQVRELELELSESVSALQELKKVKSFDTNEEQRFSKLVSTISAKTRGLAFKPFFEKLSKEKNIEMKDLSEKVNPIDSANPLSETFNEVDIEMRFPQISIPRILSLVSDVEKSEHYIRLKEIKITGQYGNKLFFDTTLMFRGYQGKK
ncbi:MAG: hypothetical protein HYW48_00570 [Deltaproteobacteria bacterium]|nr:hypothetical protein [Deltaproteobacteria bacterium]